VEISSGNPYVILKEEDNKQYRLFAGYQKKDMYWHRDREDREIKLLSGEMSFQKDNELPVKMEAGSTVFCAANVLHRIIPNESWSPFIIEITFL
tara:strand:- start:1808 stop:2089 length:282 start_codon:yes stop_codon:yes gene_type:complete